MSEYVRFLSGNIILKLLKRSEATVKCKACVIMCRDAQLVLNKLVWLLEVVWPCEHGSLPRKIIPAEACTQIIFKISPPAFKGICCKFLS